MNPLLFRSTFVGVTPATMTTSLRQGLDTGLGGAMVRELIAMADRNRVADQYIVQTESDIKFLGNTSPRVKAMKMALDNL